MGKGRWGVGVSHTDDTRLFLNVSHHRLSIYVNIILVREKASPNVRYFGNYTYRSFLLSQDPPRSRRWTLTPGSRDSRGEV